MEGGDRTFAPCWPGEGPRRIRGEGPLKVTVISLNRERLPEPLIPVGAATAAAVFRANGDEVQLLDLCHQPDPVAAVREHLREWCPDLVGLSIRNLENNQMGATRSYLGQARTAVETIQEACPEVPILAGGAGFSLFPAEVLDDLGLSWGLAGEAEASLRPLVEAIAAGVRPSGISGACYRQDGPALANGTARLPHFGQAVLPAYDLLDCPAYVAQGAVLPIEAKRGCDLGCAFCPESADRGRARLKPPAQVADEIEALTALVGTNRLSFTDGLFQQPPEHAEAVCREIIRRGLRVRWTCGVSPVGLSRELLGLMREAGCRGVALGLDSVTPGMLRRYRKGFRQEHIEPALRALREAGLQFAVYILFGGPGETPQSMAEALDLLEQLAPDDPVFFALGIRIYRGTPLEGTARREGIIRPGDDLLKPTYYLAPGLDIGMLDVIERRCRDHERWFSGPEVTRRLESSRQGPA